MEVCLYFLHSSPIFYTYNVLQGAKIIPEIQLGVSSNLTFVKLMCVGGLRFTVYLAAETQGCSMESFVCKSQFRRSEASV